MTEEEKFKKYLRTLNEENSINKKEDAMQGLLDLYNKEKEENASLQKEIKLMKSININDNYISKDKLKNKIEELNNKIDGDDYWKFTTQQYVGMQYQVGILEELLEE